MSAGFIVDQEIGSDGWAENREREEGTKVDLGTGSSFGVMKQKAALWERERVMMQRAELQIPTESVYVYKSFAMAYRILKSPKILFRVKLSL